GESWTVVPADHTLHGVSCPSPIVCYAVGNFGYAVRTGDGGKTWAPVGTPDLGSLDAVSCPNTATCVAVSSPGALLRTANEGKTWTVARAATGLNAVSCASDKACVAVGQNGQVLAGSG